MGVIRDGELVATQRVEDLFAQRMNRISLIFESHPPVEAFKLPGVSVLESTNKGIILEVKENLPAVLAAAAENNVMDIETHNVTLEEIFLTYYSQDQGGSHV